MAEDVLVERGNGLLVIMLNRPHVRNAMDAAMSVRIAAAVDELDADDALSVAILTGTGGSFCAGMDLKAFLRGERPEVAGRGFGGLTQAPPVKPLIAAVEGHALAGAVSWCLPVTWWWRREIRLSVCPRFAVGSSRARVDCCGCRSGYRRPLPPSTR